MSSSAEDTGAIQPNPHQDRNATAMPAHIAHALGIVRILLGFGRHLIATLESRAMRRSFAVIAYCFGTARVPAILSRLHRGVLRAAALERVLLERAARGRDLVLLKQSGRAPRTPPPGAPAAPPAHPAAAPAPARIRRIAAEPLGESVHLPEPQQLEAVVRRQTVGRAIVAICLDLGIRPAQCSVGFWNDLFDMMRWYRGSLGLLISEMQRRERAYAREADRHPALSLPDTSRGGTRRAIGFFVGETPVNPYADPASGIAPAAAAGWVPMAAAPARPP